MKITRQMPSIIVLTVVLWLMITTIFSGGGFRDVVATIAAIVGAGAIWFEMRRSKDMAEGEFIINLNDSFLGSDDIKSVYRKLNSKEPITEEDRISVVEYLTFFETIFILIERNVATLALVDDLFSYRFFLAINNHDIQNLELIRDAQYYKNIYTLDYRWKRYRIKHKLALDEDCLEEQHPQYLDYVMSYRKR